MENVSDTSNPETKSSTTNIEKFLSSERSNDSVTTTNIEKFLSSERSNDSVTKEDVVPQTADGTKSASNVESLGSDSLLINERVSSMGNPDGDRSTNMENKRTDDEKTLGELQEDVHSNNVQKQEGNEEQQVNVVEEEKDSSSIDKDVSKESEDVSSNKEETSNQEEVNTEEEQENLNKTDDSPKEEEWLDILGSGQLKKKILNKAPNSYRPQNLMICEVNIEGRLEDETVFEKLEHFRFQLGDNEVIQGLDLCVALMEVGEEALLEVGPRFAYGYLGLAPTIPPDATLTYKVELLSAENEPELDTLNVSERSKIGNMKRERGNWWYERENYTAAIQCYRRAIEYLDELQGGIQIEKENKNEEIAGGSAEDEWSLLDDRLKVFNNLAAAQMKIRSFDTALESVEKVLLCQPENVKALFRKGKILAAKGETSDAITILRLANQLEPESKTIKQELARLLDVNRRETKLEKNMYKRMLGQDSHVEVNTSKPSKFTQMPWGVVFGSIAAMVAGVVVYRYKFL